MTTAAPPAVAEAPAASFDLLFSQTQPVLFRIITIEERRIPSFLQVFWHVYLYSIGTSELPVIGGAVTQPARMNPVKASAI